MSAYLSWYAKDGSYNILRFDVVLSESADFTSEVTSHAVERGANMSDHVRDVQPTASIETFISQKPITGKSLVKPGTSDGFSTSTLLRFPAYVPTFTPTPGGLTTAVGGLIQGPPPTQQKVSVLKFVTPINRPEQVLQVLFALKQSAQLLEVNAPSYSVKDCELTHIGLARGPEDGQGLNFTLDFTGVRRVSSKRTDQVVPADIKATKKTDKGNKGGEEVGKPEDQSWFSSLLGMAPKSGGLL